MLAVDFGDCLGQLVFLVVGQFADVFDFVSRHDCWYSVSLILDLLVRLESGYVSKSVLYLGDAPVERSGVRIVRLCNLGLLTQL